MTTHAQGAALAVVALNDGMILVNDEMTAGPYWTATDRTPRYAIIVDRPAQHWLSKGRHVFTSPESVAWSLVQRFGVGGVRRMVDVAYRRKDRTPPATPPKAAKRGRKRNGAAPDLSPRMLAVLRKIAAQPPSEPVLWGLDRSTVRALAARGLVVPESTSHSGHFGRFGQSVSANRASLKHYVETGARLTSAGRSALTAHDRQPRAG